ncbi:Arc family DNA-binding protein [uncultured Nitratireductor sp.]|uniref:Arc family DNA-binding protein n=1 Tax=uncultured Nitratireductor sp. TaxID=520953 RepID=UPI002626B6CB|nr:Arc family DNA-binding protein [uncultured Nitratireductor sp.]
MVKKSAAKDQDKFVVRLPDGMRDRIKAKADRAGMSMNEAIVWCLDQYFPAPTTIDEKLNELADMVSILKGDNTYEGVDRLVAAVQDTIGDVYSGALKTPPEFNKLVSERFERWQEEEQANLRERHENPFDDANWPSEEDPFPDPVDDEKT